LPEAQKIFDLIEGLAPRALAEPWDNVGLMVGTGKTMVTKVALALDPTLDTIQAAHDAGAQLLLTHHPLIFSPLKKIDFDDPSAAAAALAVKLGVTVYSAHTNLDAAEDGVSWALARRLDLRNISVLSPTLSSTRLKLVVFVPTGYEKRVRDALFDAGAGQIGQYTGCSFAVRGQGTFTPSEKASPFLGNPGRSELVNESRLEAMIDEQRLNGALRALKEAHPYEEAAFDLYPLKDAAGIRGIGCVGLLPDARSLDSLVECVKERLAAGNVKVAGATEELIKKVAVVGGSGGSYIGLAKASEAQVLISGDFGYHQAREAESLGIPLIDAGHFATEKPILAELAQRLSVLLELEGINLKFEVLAGEKDPWRK